MAGAQTSRETSLRVRLNCDQASAARAIADALATLDLSSPVYFDLRFLKRHDPETIEVLMAYFAAHPEAAGRIGVIVQDSLAALLRLIGANVFLRIVTSARTMRAAA